MALDAKSLEALADKVASTPPSVDLWGDVWEALYGDTNDIVYNASFSPLIRLGGWESAATRCYPPGWMRHRMRTEEAPDCALGWWVEVTLIDDRKFAILSARSRAGGADVVASLGAATLAAAIRAHAFIIRNRQIDTSMSQAGS